MNGRLTKALASMQPVPLRYDEPMQSAFDIALTTIRGHLPDLEVDKGVAMATAIALQFRQLDEGFIPLVKRARDQLELCHSEKDITQLHKDMRVALERGFYLPMVDIGGSIGWQNIHVAAWRGSDGGATTFTIFFNGGGFDLWVDDPEAAKPYKAPGSPFESAKLAMLNAQARVDAVRRDGAAS